MTAARHVGVGEFVDQNDLWPASDDGVEVHFLKPLALVLKAPARNDIETFQQYFGLFPAMSLHAVDDNIVAVFASGTGLLQHFVGLADARRRTHKDLELTDATLFSPGRLSGNTVTDKMKALLIKGMHFLCKPYTQHQLQNSIEELV